MKSAICPVNQSDVSEHKLRCRRGQLVPFEQRVSVAHTKHSGLKALALFANSRSSSIRLQMILRISRPKTVPSSQAGNRRAQSSGARFR
jgi:hypothetical protein